MGKASSNDAPGMKGDRARTADGSLREQRGDTHMGTVERIYGRDFGVRSDMHLDTFLERKGVDSLNDLINGD